MAFKVAFIGAGSIGFTRGLLADLLTVPEFHDIEVAFMDINPDNLRMVTQLCQRDIDENGLNIKIHATLDRREAFAGAKYVINCVRIGMLEAFATDVDTSREVFSSRVASQLPEHICQYSNQMEQFSFSAVFAVPG